MPVEGTEGHATGPMGPMGQKRKKGVPISGNRGMSYGISMVPWDRREGKDCGTLSMPEEGTEGHLWSHGTEGKEKSVGLQVYL